MHGILRCCYIFAAIAALSRLDAQTDSDYELAISNATGLVGEEAEVSIYISSIANLDGWAFSVCSDSDVVDPPELAEAVPSDEIATSNGGSPLFFYILLSDASAFHIGVLVSFQGKTLAAGEEIPLYTLLNDLIAAGECDLAFCDHYFESSGVLPAGEFFIGSSEVVPTFTNGSITAIAPTFLRRDANADGAVTGLEDAIALLNWQFGGGNLPHCLDVADFDDDGEIDAIADALYLLSYYFLRGAAPPAPGVEGCGVDPTSDSLECAPTPQCM